MPLIKSNRKTSVHGDIHKLRFPNSPLDGPIRYLVSCEAESFYIQGNLSYKILDFAFS